MGKEYIISKEYLAELIDISSRNLVGKVCKRFELSTNLSDIKNQTKELIYEQFREFNRLLEAHQYGFEQSTFVFKSNDKKGKE
jgi:septin family protein